MTDPRQIMPNRWERLEYEDAIAALRSLVGDHDIHPAHLPDCAICVALNGRTRFDRAPASKNTETPR